MASKCSSADFGREPVPHAQKPNPPPFLGRPVETTPLDAHRPQDSASLHNELRKLGPLPVPDLIADDPVFRALVDTKANLEEPTTAFASLFNVITSSVNSFVASTFNTMSKLFSDSSASSVFESLHHISGIIGSVYIACRTSESVKDLTLAIITLTSHVKLAIQHWYAAPLTATMREGVASLTSVQNMLAEFRNSFVGRLNAWFTTQDPTTHERPQSSSASNAVSLAVRFLMGITSVVMTATGYKNFDRVLQSINTSKQTYENLENLCGDFCYQTLGHDPTSSGVYRELAADIDQEATELLTITPSEYNRQYLRRIEDLLERRKTLLMTPAKRIVNNAITQSIAELQKRIPVIRNLIKMTTDRPTPVAGYFHGSPGCGKSCFVSDYLVPQLTKWVNEGNIGTKLTPSLYRINTAGAHYIPYFDEPWYLFEDFGRSSSGNDNWAAKDAMAIEIVNGGECILPGAAVEEKTQAARFIGGFATSNISLGSASLGLRSAFSQALQHRFTSFKVSDPQDTDTTTARFASKPWRRADFDHLEFAAETTDLNIVQGSTYKARDVLVYFMHAILRAEENFRTKKQIRAGPIIDPNTPHTPIQIPHPPSMTYAEMFHSDSLRGENTLHNTDTPHGSTIGRLLSPPVEPRPFSFTYHRDTQTASAKNPTIWVHGLARSCKTTRFLSLADSFSANSIPYLHCSGFNNYPDTPESRSIIVLDDVVDPTEKEGRLQYMKWYDSLIPGTVIIVLSNKVPDKPPPPGTIDEGFYRRAGWLPSVNSTTFPWTDRAAETLIPGILDAWDEGGKLDIAFVDTIEPPFSRKEADAWIDFSDTPTHAQLVQTLFQQGLCSMAYEVANKVFSIRTDLSTLDGFAEILRYVQNIKPMINCYFRVGHRVGYISGRTVRLCKNYGGPSIIFRNEVPYLQTSLVPEPIPVPKDMVLALYKDPYNPPVQTEASRFLIQTLIHSEAQSSTTIWNDLINWASPSWQDKSRRWLNRLRHVTLTIWDHIKNIDYRAIAAALLGLGSAVLMFKQFCPNGRPEQTTKELEVALDGAGLSGWRVQDGRHQEILPRWEGRSAAWDPSGNGGVGQRRGKYRFTRKTHNIATVPIDKLLDPQTLPSLQSHEQPLVEEPLDREQKTAWLKAVEAIQKNIVSFRTDTGFHIGFGIALHSNLVVTPLHVVSASTKLVLMDRPQDFRFTVLHTDHTRDLAYINIVHGLPVRALTAHLVSRDVFPNIKEVHFPYRTGNTITWVPFSVHYENTLSNPLDYPGAPTSMLSTISLTSKALHPADGDSGTPLIAMVFANGTYTPIIYGLHTALRTLSHLTISSTLAAEDIMSLLKPSTDKNQSASSRLHYDYHTTFTEDGLPTEAPILCPEEFLPYVSEERVLHPPVDFANPDIIKPVGQLVGIESGRRLRFLHTDTAATGKRSAISEQAEDFLPSVMLPARSFSEIPDEEAREDARGYPTPILNRMHVLMTQTRHHDALEACQKAGKTLARRHYTVSGGNKVRIMSEDTLLGKHADYVEGSPHPINLDASAGPTLNVMYGISKKGDILEKTPTGIKFKDTERAQHVRALHLDSWEMAKRGKRPWVLGQIKRKDEQLPAEKINRPRVFIVRDFLGTLLEKKVLGPVQGLIMNNHWRLPPQIGVDFLPGMGHIFERLRATGHKRGISIDFSGFDLTVPPELLAGVKEYVLELYQLSGEKNPNVLRAISTIMDTILVQYNIIDGVIYRMVGTVPSGMYGTSLVDSICVEIALMVALDHCFSIKAPQFFRDFVLMTSGDDAVVSWKPDHDELDWEKIAKAFRDLFGLKATPGDKKGALGSVPVAALTFVSRGFVPLEGTRYWVGKIKTESLAKSLHWAAVYNPGDIKSFLLNIRDEMVPYGRESYTRFEAWVAHVAHIHGFTWDHQDYTEAAEGLSEHVINTSPTARRILKEVQRKPRIQPRSIAEPSLPTLSQINTQIQDLEVPTLVHENADMKWSAKQERAIRRDFLNGADTPLLRSFLSLKAWDMRSTIERSGSIPFKTHSTTTQVPQPTQLFWLWAVANPEKLDQASSMSMAIITSSPEAPTPLGPARLKSRNHLRDLAQAVVNRDLRKALPVLQETAMTMEPLDLEILHSRLTTIVRSSTEPISMQRMPPALTSTCASSVQNHPHTNPQPQTTPNTCACSARTPPPTIPPIDEVDHPQGRPKLSPPPHRIHKHLRKTSTPRLPSLLDGLLPAHQISPAVPQHRRVAVALRCRPQSAKSSQEQSLQTLLQGTTTHTEIPQAETTPSVTSPVQTTSTPISHSTMSRSDTKDSKTGNTHTDPSTPTKTPHQCLTDSHTASNPLRQAHTQSSHSAQNTTHETSPPASAKEEDQPSDKSSSSSSAEIHTAAHTQNPKHDKPQAALPVGPAPPSLGQPAQVAPGDANFNTGPLAQTDSTPVQQAMITPSGIHPTGLLAGGYTRDIRDLAYKNSRVSTKTFQSQIVAGTVIDKITVSPWDRSFIGENIFPWADLHSAFAGSFQLTFSTHASSTVYGSIRIGYVPFSLGAFDATVPEPTLADMSKIDTFDINLQQGGTVAITITPTTDRLLYIKRGDTQEFMGQLIVMASTDVGNGFGTSVPIPWTRDIRLGGDAFYTTPRHAVNTRSSSTGGDFTVPFFDLTGMTPVTDGRRIPVWNTTATDYTTETVSRRVKFDSFNETFKNRVTWENDDFVWRGLFHGALPAANAVPEDSIRGVWKKPTEYVDTGYQPEVTNIVDDLATSQYIQSEFNLDNRDHPLRLVTRGAYTMLTDEFKDWYRVEIPNVLQHAGMYFWGDSIKKTANGYTVPAAFTWWDQGVDADDWNNEERLGYLDPQVINRWTTMDHDHRHPQTLPGGEDFKEGEWYGFHHRLASDKESFADEVTTGWVDGQAFVAPQGTAEGNIGPAGYARVEFVSPEAIVPTVRTAATTGNHITLPSDDRQTSWFVSMRESGAFTGDRSFIFRFATATGIYVTEFLVNKFGIWANTGNAYHIFSGLNWSSLRLLMEVSTIPFPTIRAPDFTVITSLNRETTRFTGIVNLTAPGHQVICKKDLGKRKTYNDKPQAKIALAIAGATLGGNLFTAGKNRKHQEKMFGLATEFETQFAKQQFKHNAALMAGSHLLSGLAEQAAIKQGGLQERQSMTHAAGIQSKVNSKAL